MTTATAPIIMISKTGKTQYSARVEGCNNTVVITYRSGWSNGGNDYGSAAWIVSQPEKMFAIKSFPATQNNPRMITKAMVAFVHGFITEQG